MFTKEAIQELAESQAITSANTALGSAMVGIDSPAAVALPESFTVTDLEKMMVNRRRARGTMSTTVLADFAAYVARHLEAGAAAFVDPAQMGATAVLNLGNAHSPGHADNLAVLRLQRTAAYSALVSKANGSALKQQDAAEFLEDWSSCITCTDDDGTLIEVRKAVAAIRRLTIESARKVESEIGRLSATSSALDSVKASSVEPIPALVHFTTAPYLGLPERTFSVRVGILTTEKPALVLRIVNAEKHSEEMAEELAILARDALGGTVPVMIGSYKVGT